MLYLILVVLAPLVVSRSTALCWTSVVTSCPHFHHHPSRFSHRLLFLSSFFGNSSRLLILEVDSAPGAARRRRERRLGQFMRHERLSASMALSEKSTTPLGVRGRTGPGRWVRDSPHGRTEPQAGALQLVRGTAPSRFVWFSVSHRWRNSWWKCLLSSLRFSSSLMRRSSTFHACLGARVVLGCGSLHGFLPGQSSSPSAEQTVDIPVPGRGGSGSGGLQGFHPTQSSTASVEQISVVSQEEVGQGVFFALFPVRKKCGGCREFECEGARALEPIHAGGL